MSLPGVSVVICCHNSASRLPPTLRHLAAQVVEDGMEWEVVVVNNASTDETVARVEAECPETLRSRLRIVDEPKAGLSFARVTGVREARHEIVSFVDDDNWVCDDWISRVAKIFTDPTVGAAGGAVEAECEICPPAWFEEIQGYYAVGRPHAATGDITDAPGTLLWGAGLTLRKEAWDGLMEQKFNFLLTGRSGSRLTAGEDTELCFALRAAGWRLWYDEGLVLKHFIPAGRLRWSYALKLMRGMGGSSVLFNLYLMAFRRHPFERQAEYKQTWLFQWVKALGQSLRFIVLHPSAWIQPKEGEPAALTMESIKGHLASLWALRGNYKDLLESIRTASWNKGGGERRAESVERRAGSGGRRGNG